MSPLVLQGIANLINFILFIGILVYFAGKPIKKYLADKHEGTMRAIREAEEANRHASEALATTTSRLANIETEFAAVVDQAQKIATAQGEAIAQQAKADADRLRASAKAEIERERQEAVGEIRKLVLAQAFERATLELQQQMSPDQQRNLVNNLIQKVGDGSLALK